jgi:subtilisin family serine protease
MAGCLALGPAAALARGPNAGPNASPATSATATGPDHTITAQGPRGAAGAPGASGQAARPGIPTGPAGLPVSSACDAVPGHVLIRFAGGAGPSARAATVAAIHGNRIRAYRLVPGLELDRTSLPVAQAVAAARRQHGVLAAEADCRVHIDQVPNDPDLAQEWGLRNTGQTGGTTGADIDAATAWDVRTDASSVTVAVIDTGMQLNHPDLAANLWTNPGEIVGNGIDDDNNGYVDDVHGWDFVNQDANPTDDNGHGTHVSGTIGARGDNGVGVTGVAWRVKLMPLKAFNASGQGQVSAIIAALDYAVANGAKISNNSYSGPEFDRAEYDAFAAAGAAGHLAIAAAGNDGVSNDEHPHYPASYRLDTVVSVAATNDSDALSSFSDFGTIKVDVAAPGEAIYSTWLGSGYQTLSGTSMATPHVVGVAALVAAEHPAWTALEIRDRILGTTRPVAGLADKTWTGGVIDAGIALSNAVTDLPPAPPPPTPQVFVATNDPAPTPAPVAPPAPPVFPTADVIESTENDVGFAPKIALDGSGHPNIAYAKAYDGVQLLTLANGTWGSRPLTHVYDDFYWMDLAMNAAGVPTVAVQRSWSDLAAYSDPGIVLVTGDTPTPTETRLTAACPDADTCFWDWNPAIAYDATGAAHVVFSRTAPFGNDAVFAPGGSAPSVLGTGLYYATNASGDWVVWRLTTEAVAGPPAIAVEADGTAHITVRRAHGAESGLTYFTDEGGTWTSLQLTNHAEDFWSSVGVETTGAVDVAFARPGFGLYVQRRSSGGTWGTPQLVHDGEATAPDLAIDPADHVHVVFGLVDGFNTVAGVGYATNRTGSWVESTVAGGQAHDASLAVDAAGHAHVAYQQATGSVLGIFYATNTTGSFVSSLARASSSEGGTGNTTSYAVDASGHHHVALGSRYGEASAGLYYGTDLSGSWVFTKLDSNWPVAIAMTLDASGHPHIAFTNQSGPNWRVGYATNATGAWHVEDAVPGSNFQGAVAIVLDASGRPQIVYPDGQAAHLLRARKQAAGWAVDTIFSGTQVRDPSATLDGTGVLHVAFTIQMPLDAGFRVEYLHGTTGAWAAEDVTGGTAYRFNPTIGRAADGTIWISDWTIDNQIWVHRHPTSGGWDGTLIDAALGDAWPTLAIDRDGVVHIAFGTGAFYGSSGCTIPECPAGPGLRHAVLGGGTWTITKLTPYWQDALATLAVGGDGSLSVAFLRTDVGMRSLELLAGKPGATVSLQAGSDTGSSSTDGLTNASTLTFDVVFNRPVNGLAAGDFSIGGTATGCIAGAPTGAGAAYAVTVSGCSAGTVSLRLAADAVTDGSAVAGPAAQVTAPTVVVDLTNPTTSEPIAAIRSGVTLSGTAIPVRLTWSGADGGGSGVDHYEVARALNGSITWTVLATPAAASFDLLAGSSGTVRFGARAIDRAGNVGDWVGGPPLNPRLSQETSGVLTYHGAWSTATSSPYSGGAARYATGAGASATYTFIGRNLALVSTRAPSRGKVKIYVDGVYAGTVDLSGTVRYRSIVWQRHWTTAARHTVSFVVVGTAGRPRVDLDAIAVVR